MNKKWFSAFAVILIIITLGIAWSLFFVKSDLPKLEGHPPIYQLIDEDQTTRQIGTEGHANFENILLQKMASAGLKPEGSNYRQPFDMIGINYDTGPVFNVGGGEEQINFEILSDFQTYYDRYTGGIDYSGEILFLESTFYSVDPILFKGKVIATKFNVMTDDIIQYARENGARGLLIFEDTPQRQGMYFNPYFGQKRANDIYVGKISSETYATLKTIALNNRIDNQTSGPVSGKIQGVTLSVKDTYPVLTGYNLVGKLSGVDHSRYVVFYTYYDGMGYYLGEQYQNIMQKLTGVSALTELIEYASLLEEKPKIDVYFAFVDGGAASDEGMAQLSSNLSNIDAYGEFIEIGVLGLTGSSALNVGIVNQDRKANKLSAILGSKVAQYIETSGYSVGGAEILPTNGSSYLIGESVPSILLTQNVNENSLAKLMSKDSIELMDVASYNDAVTAIESFMAAAYFGENGFVTLPKQGKIGIFIAWLMFAFVIFVANVKHEGGSRWVTIYRSTYFQILQRIVQYVIPTALMLVMLLFILLVPSDITKADYGGQYSNYVFQLHFQRVVHYVIQFFEGSGNYLTPALKTALLVGFKNTLRLFLATVSISTVLGLFLGLLRAIKKNTVIDVMVLILYAIPDVLISLLGIYAIIFLFKHNLLANITPEDMRTKYMPIVVMCIVPTIYIIRLIQMKTEQILQEPFVFGEIARGIPKDTIIWNHVFPMLVSFLFSSMGSIIRIIMVNLLIVEYLYASVGIGAYLVINRYDPTYVLLISVILGSMYVITNAIFKGLNYWMDPMRRKS